MNKNTTKTMSGDEVLELAKKASYVALRTLSQKSGMKSIQDMQLEVNRYPDCSADTQDIISIACLAIIESEEEDAFLDAIKKINDHVFAEKKSARSKKTCVWIDDPETGEVTDVRQDIINLINCIDDNEIINSLSESLSSTQRQVLKLMGYGFSNRQIADKLNRSEGTIASHVFRIKEKANTRFPDMVKTKNKLAEVKRTEGYKVDLTITIPSNFPSVHRVSVPCVPLFDEITLFRLPSNGIDKRINPLIKVW